MPREIDKIKNKPLNPSYTFVEGENAKPRVAEPKFASLSEEPLLTAKQMIPPLADCSASRVALDRDPKEAIESNVIWKTRK